MGLMDEIRAANAVNPQGPRCGLEVLLEDLQKPDADDLRDAMANPRIRTSVISKVLAEQGHFISVSAIGRHRKGECRCARL